MRDGHEIVLFETKKKALTSKSRTGDMMAFIDDYTRSFLATLRQLVRHDRNIKRGLTPLNRIDDDLIALRVTKIAASPVSLRPGERSCVDEPLDAFHHTCAHRRRRWCFATRPDYGWVQQGDRTNHEAHRLGRSPEGRPRPYGRLHDGHLVVGPRPARSTRLRPPGRFSNRRPATHHHIKAKPTRNAT